MHCKDIDGILEEAFDLVRDNLVVGRRKKCFKVYENGFTGSEAILIWVRNGLCASIQDAEFIGNLLIVRGLIKSVSHAKGIFEDGFHVYQFPENESLRTILLLGKTCTSSEIERVSKEFSKGVPVSDHKQMSSESLQVFRGTEAVAFLINKGYAYNEFDACRIGNILLEDKLFKHITGDYDFENKAYFYLFTLNVQEELKQVFAQADNSLKIPPMDSHNLKLIENVHPNDWSDPIPCKEKYNLVVIGGGSGGLVAAVGAAGLGAKVALIEEKWLGGDCLNVGCVPSKSLLKSAHVAASAEIFSEYGMNGSVQVDFQKVMERVRRIRADLSPHDSAKRFTDLGIDVFIGRGTFLSPNEISVNGKSLRFSKAVIASGGSPLVPSSIKGINSIPYHTNETIFNLTSLPKRLLVIGGGPIGCELSQAFRRLGSQVFLFQRSLRIMDREEREASEILQTCLVRDGVDLCLGVSVEEVVQSNGEITLTYNQDGERKTVSGDVVLLCTGRKANVDGMDLEKALVQYSQKGIEINKYMQTTCKNIYAVGDCCSEFKFTHVSDAMSRLVLRNALFGGRASFPTEHVAWCTFTDPEVAHVGLYPGQMLEKGMKFDTYTKYSSDRAFVEGSVRGYVRVYVKRGSDKIIGATIVGEGAGEIITEVSIAMSGKIGLGSLNKVIFPYPTRSEALKACSDLCNRGKLTPFVRKLFRKWLSFKRK